MKTGSAIKCLATKFMLECASNIIQFQPILKTLRNASLKRGQEIHFRIGVFWSEGAQIFSVFFLNSILLQQNTVAFFRGNSLKFLNIPKNSLKNLKYPLKFKNIKDP